MKRALITGITGQDGSYLAELLLSKGYEVHGTIRRSSSFNTGRIDAIFDRLHLHYADMTDPLSLIDAVSKSQPDEVYNLAAQSHVRVSFDQPAYTYQTIAVGTINILDAVLRMPEPAKLYQASSSEMFGSSPPPQCESTPFRPRSPYACAKVAAFHQVVNYRESRGLFACNGILFNHESPRRGETFVTRKITRAAARIKLGLQDKVYLGNLDAYRDWGHAREYAEAMWLMLQQDKPDDFVIATGAMNSIRDFLNMTFSRLDMDWRDFVRFDARLLRPSEVDSLCGDARKAARQLEWTPGTLCRELAEEMVDADLELARREVLVCST